MPKFIIPVIPPTTNKSVRFPNPMIEQVEMMIAGKNTTFSSFVVEAVRVALISLEEQQASPRGEAVERSETDEV